MAKLADAADLKSAGEIRTGANPVTRINEYGEIMAPFGNAQ